MTNQVSKYTLPCCWIYTTNITHFQIYLPGSSMISWPSTRVHRKEPPWYRAQSQVSNSKSQSRSNLWIRNDMKYFPTMFIINGFDFPGHLFYSFLTICWSIKFIVGYPIRAMSTPNEPGFWVTISFIVRFETTLVVIKGTMNCPY